MTQFGSLDAVLKRTPEGPNLLASAGPISDAFILSTEPVVMLNGPVGSAKTTASVKKAIVEAQRVPPWDAGRRTYTLAIFRQKYDLLWSATIPSWNKIFPVDLGHWTGSSPRRAEHVIDWSDAWGPVRLIARFAAFGEAADPEDLRGVEYADAWLNEADTMPEALFVAISGRVARAPGRATLGRPGKVWGDLNAPDVLNWTYRDFWEDPPPGYRLYRQPGGLEPGAENPALGRAYYEDIIAKNVKRPWYIRRMVHNRPGFTRDADVVYPAYDDDLHLAEKPLAHIASLPVIVGVDGGNTPAAVWMQERPDGQLRILAETALESAGMIALARSMQTVEAALFKGAEFYTVCDPAMKAGEETEEKSDRSRLASLLGRPVHLARTNDPVERCQDIGEKLLRRTESGEPALLLDRRCKRLRRGFSQTYAYHRVRGTDERGRILKNPDSHPCDAAGYAAMECGQGHARMLRGQRERELRRRQEQARDQGRYNPLKHERQR